MNTLPAAGPIPQPAIATQLTAPAPLAQTAPVQTAPLQPVQPVAAPPMQTVAVAAAATTKGITCPNLQCSHAGKLRTKATTHLLDGTTRRTKLCEECQGKFITAEVFVELAPAK